MSTNTQKETHVDTESSDICSGLAAHPEDTQMAVIIKFNNSAFVDGSDTKLALDGGD